MRPEISIIPASKAELESPTVIPTQHLQVSITAFANASDLKICMTLVPQGSVGGSNLRNGGYVLGVAMRTMDPHDRTWRINDEMRLVPFPLSFWLCFLTFLCNEQTSCLEISWLTTSVY